MSVGTVTSAGDYVGQRYREQRVLRWDTLARRSVDAAGGEGRHYHSRLARVYRHLIAPGSTVLELGCGRGDLLAKLRPRVGVGVDFSPEMVARAQEAHPHLHFCCADAHELELGQTFDF